MPAQFGIDHREDFVVNFQRRGAECLFSLRSKSYIGVLDERLDNSREAFVYRNG